MKLKTTSNGLNSQLALVSRAISSRPVQPVLGNFLLSANADTQQATLTGFDLSLGIQIGFSAEVTEPGSLTLPAKLLSDIVSRLPEDELHLVTEGSDSTACRLSCKSGKYEIQGISSQEYPDLPLLETPDETRSIPVQALLDCLQATLFAASSDENRQVLTGVHLKLLSDRIEAASTDGHRLSVYSVALDNPQEAIEPIETTIPAKALRELVRMLAANGKPDTVSLRMSQGQLVFLWDTACLTSRMLEGQYPNYPQLIPRSFVRLTYLDRRELITALDRIAVLADQKQSVIKLALTPKNNEVALSVDAQDVGSGREILTAQFGGEVDAPFEIGFNVKYLTEGLKAMNTTDVCLQTNTATSPAVLTPVGGGSHTFLLMPIQFRDR